MISCVTEIFKVYFFGYPSIEVQEVRDYVRIIKTPLLNLCLVLGILDFTVVTLGL